MQKLTLSILEDASHFLHVNELKEIVEKLKLSDKGPKKALIDNIMSFIKTGTIK